MQRNKGCKQDTHTANIIFVLFNRQIFKQDTFASEANFLTYWPGFTDRV